MLDIPPPDRIDYALQLSERLFYQAGDIEWAVAKMGFLIFVNSELYHGDDKSEYISSEIGPGDFLHWPTFQKHLQHLPRRRIPLIPTPEMLQYFAEIKKWGSTLINGLSRLRTTYSDLKRLNNIKGCCLMTRILQWDDVCCGMRGYEVWKDEDAEMSKLWLRTVEEGKEFLRRGMRILGTEVHIQTCLGLKLFFPWDSMLSLDVDIPEYKGPREDVVAGIRARTTRYWDDE